VSTTVLGVGALTPVSGIALVLMAGVLFSRPNVNAASALVNGVPLDHLTPVRRVKVSCRPPSAQA